MLLHSSRFFKVDPIEGQVLCNLFDKADGFPGDNASAIRSLAVQVDKEKVVCDFGAVPAGTTLSQRCTYQHERQMDSNHRYTQGRMGCFQQRKR